MIAPSYTGQALAVAGGAGGSGGGAYGKKKGHWHRSCAYGGEALDGSESRPRRSQVCCRLATCTLWAWRQKRPRPGLPSCPRTASITQERDVVRDYRRDKFTLSSRAWSGSGVSRTLPFTSSQRRTQRRYNRIGLETPYATAVC